MIDKDKIERLSETHLSKEELAALSPEEREALRALLAFKIGIITIRTIAMLIILGILYMFLRQV